MNLQINARYILIWPLQTLAIDSIILFRTEGLWNAAVIQEQKEHGMPISLPVDLRLHVTPHDLKMRAGLLAEIDGPLANRLTEPTRPNLFVMLLIHVFLQDEFVDEGHQQVFICYCMQEQIDRLYWWLLVSAKLGRGGVGPGGGGGKWKSLFTRFMLAHHP